MGTQSDEKFTPGGQSKKKGYGVEFSRAKPFPPPLCFICGSGGWDASIARDHFKAEAAAGQEHHFVVGRTPMARTPRLNPGLGRLAGRPSPEKGGQGELLFGARIRSCGGTARNSRGERIREAQTPGARIGQLGICCTDSQR